MRVVLADLTVQAARRHPAGEWGNRMTKPTRRAPRRASRPEPISIIESSHDAIIGIDRAGIVTTWNPAATRLYGYAQEEIVGHSLEVLYPPARRGEAQEVLRRILDGEEIGQYLTDRKKKDGTIIEVSLTASPIVDPAGATVGVAMVSRLLTQLQDARDRFEIRVDKERLEAEEGRGRHEEGVEQERTDAKDAQDRYEKGVDQERTDAKDAQDRYEERVGQERIETREARERYEEGVDQDRIEAREARDRFEERVDKDRVDSKDAQDRFEIRVDRDRLEARNAQDRIQLERRGARRDMADLEAQLDQARRLESLGQLAGGIAHDFNNLLAVILNYATFVAEELGDATESDWSQHCESARSDIGQIQQAAERAAALTHQLLAFARQEVIRPRVLDLNDVVAGIEEHAAPDHRRERPARHLAGRRAVAGAGRSRPPRAGARQPGGQRTRRHARRRHGDHRYRERHRGCEFDRRRVAGATRTQRAAACQRHRHRHAPRGRRARLRAVLHHEGQGRRDRARPGYRIRDPQPGRRPHPDLLRTQQRHHHQRHAARHRRGSRSGRRKLVPYQRAPSGETVLVVEDEEALREVTRRIFTRNGYHVITAADGPEALDIARHHDGEIHLLVTDVVMPHMLGKEVADRIKAINPEIEVLYMSGYARPVLASQGPLDAGVALVEKPFSETDLLRTAGQLLNGHFSGFRTVPGAGTNAP